MKIHIHVVIRAGRGTGWVNFRPGTELGFDFAEEELTNRHMTKEGLSNGTTPRMNRLSTTGPTTLTYSSK